MSYDLRRLRLHGPIARQEGTNTDILTSAREFAPPSSPPSSDRACPRPSLRPTSHQHPQSCAVPSTSSTTPSRTTSSAHDLEPPETCHNIQKRVDQEEPAEDPVHHPTGVPNQGDHGRSRVVGIFPEDLAAIRLSVQSSPEGPTSGPSRSLPLGGVMAALDRSRDTAKSQLEITNRAHRGPRPDSHYVAGLSLHRQDDLHNIAFLPTN